MKILLFSGSNSSVSINQSYIEYISQLLPNHKVTIIDLRTFPAPMYSYDTELSSGKPSAMVALHNLFSSHDAFVISCPEHNGTLPSNFKNTIDWLSRIEKKLFQNKPVVVFAVTPGASGAQQVLKHLQDLIPRWGGHLLATVGIPNYINFSSYDDYFARNPLVYSRVKHALETLNT